MMFKKPSQRNIRTRRDSGDEGAGGSSPEPAISSTPEEGSSVISGHMAAVASSSSLLSFHDDEESEEVFKVKKHKKRRPKKPPLAPPVPEEVDIASSPPSRVKRSPSPQPPARYPSPDSSTPTMVIQQKGEDLGRRVAEADSTTPFILSGHEAQRATECIGSFTEGTGTAGHGSSHSDFLKNILSKGDIPDATAIHLARKRRQVARESGYVESSGGGYGEQEFISLEERETVRPPVPNLGRLVREDEYDVSDEEAGAEPSKMTSGKDFEEKARREARERFLEVEQGDSDNERDEEFEHWEREQLKKAISSQQISNFRQEQARESSFGGLQQKVTFSLEDPQEEIFGAFQQPQDSLPKKLNALMLESQKSSGARAPPTLDEIAKALREKLEERRRMYEHRVSDLDKIADELIQNGQIVAKLDDLAPTLGSRYEFYQKVRTHARDVINCWDEKMVRLEFLLSKVRKLQETNSAFLAKRAKMDIEDEYQECMDDIAGTGSGAANQANQNEAYERNLRKNEREARRTRKARLARKPAGEEETLTDDELPPNRIDSEKAQMDNVRGDLEALVENVDEDYLNYEKVLEPFSTWYKLYPESFNQAFIVDCIPKLLSPLIKKDLIFWNQAKNTDNIRFLEHQPWMVALAKFGGTKKYPEGTAGGVKNGSENLAQKLSEDPRYCILPAVIEKIIIPMVSETIEVTYNPGSKTETGHLTELLKHLAKTYPTMTASSKHVDALVQKAVAKLEKAVEESVFIPLFKPGHSSKSAKNFADRQFASCIKLMDNLLAWRGFLSESFLKNQILGTILTRYLAVGLQTAQEPELETLKKAHDILERLPEPWIVASKGDKLAPLERIILAKLQPLSRTCTSQMRLNVVECSKLFRKLENAEILRVLKAFV